jgi:hypothetical protein
MTTTINLACEELLRRCDRFRDRYAAFAEHGGSAVEEAWLLEQCALLQAEALRQLSALEQLEARLQSGR